jgi:hypothetical protein
VTGRVGEEARDQLHLGLLQSETRIGGHGSEKMGRRWRTTGGRAGARAGGSAAATLGGGLALTVAAALGDRG